MMDGPTFTFGLLVALIFIASIISSNLFCRLNLYAHEKYRKELAKLIKYVSYFVISLLLIIFSAAPGFLLSILTSEEIPREAAFAVALVINLVGAHLGSRKYIDQLKDIGL